MLQNRMRVDTMNHRIKRRNAFHPSLTEASLEERVVLASGTVPLTPPPAPPPVYSRILVGGPVHWRTAKQLRAAYAHQARIETLLLQNVVGREITQFYVSHPAPTAQQLSTLKANVQGTVDAAALVLTSQTSLLPGSRARLVPGIQSALVGTTPHSLATRLNTILSSTRFTASAPRLVTAISRQIALLPRGVNQCQQLPGQSV